MPEKSRDGAAAASRQAVSPAPPPPEPKTFLARWGIVLAGSLIVLAAMAVYGNIFSAPFVFDDGLSITENPTIHHLWSALVPPTTISGVMGRPLVNLSLAINYAI